MTKPIQRALERLTQAGVDASVLYVTKTALQKSIIDATQSFRQYLFSEGVHDYRSQLQGAKEHGVSVPSYFITRTKLVPTSTSLYRPETKNGDPRVWFSRAKQLLRQATCVAVIHHQSALYIFDVFDDALWNTHTDPNSTLGAFFASLRVYEDQAVADLLAMLRAIGGRPWPTVRPGSTGVGATLEALLGIDANSSKLPDFRGIELKASRSVKSPTRVNLFAQVPDWTISQVKSSRELLQLYGYPRPERNNRPHLYCTVSVRSPNSQGLFFEIEDEMQLLHERHRTADQRSSITPVVSWRLDVLKKRLRTKHKETFWVDAETIGSGADEQFVYTKVIHTRSPMENAFVELLSNGIITMDHLISQREDGSVSEKGPLFKLLPRDIQLLFPPPLTYSLC